MNDAADRTAGEPILSSQAPAAPPNMEDANKVPHMRRPKCNAIYQSPSRVTAMRLHFF